MNNTSIWIKILPQRNRSMIQPTSLLLSTYPFVRRYNWKVIQSIYGWSMTSTSSWFLWQELSIQISCYTNSSWCGWSPILYTDRKFLYYQGSNQGRFTCKSWNIAYVEWTLGGILYWDSTLKIMGIRFFFLCNWDLQRATLEILCYEHRSYLPYDYCALSSFV